MRKIKQPFTRQKLARVGIEVLMKEEKKNYTRVQIEASNGQIGKKETETAR